MRRLTRDKEEHKRQWKACRESRKVTAPIKVKDRITGEVYPSIRALARKFGLRQTGINHQLRDDVHPRFKRA